MQGSIGPGRRTARRLAAALTCATLAAAYAEGPCVVNFQASVKEDGRWLNSNGMTVAFAVYAAPTGGAPLYAEQDCVDVVDGLYATPLGDNPQSGLAWTNLAAALAWAGTNAWLGVSLGGESELSPRERLLAAPFVLPTGSSTQTLDTLTVRRLSAGSATFEAGIAFTAPLGDIPMGTFTNHP